MPTLAKNYNPRSIERNLYQLWEESGYFNPDVCIRDGVSDATAEPFSLLMPPPNVTGVLHLGHAMENTIMDIMARYKRMRGFPTLYLPGVDHAAVATQARVEKNLIADGMQNPREELGREALLKEIRAFAEKSRNTITTQIRSTGSSCDWSRFAYTFDEKRARTVYTVFEKMYNDGLIYKGYRVVNWSVKGQSTCSDDELEHVERTSTLYTFKYAKDFPFTIATTRPETKLGDTAIAVHPNDKRYKEYIGKVFTVDVGAAKPLRLTVIADTGVDPHFGTGAVGVTPAHSHIDFEMYEKNPSIGIIPVIGKDGRMLESAGAHYAGKTAEEARAQFVAFLRENDLLIKEEPITQNVGTSDRFGDIVETLPMEQWFVAVNKEVPGRGKTLKDLMRDAVTTGIGTDAKKVRITPERFGKTYLHWIDNLRDWCISRQIWWGHRIPVWYRGDDVVVSETRPSGEGWVQDPDTLDTWFSSGTWAFSTLEWPSDTEDFSRFFPTSWMQMGHEILFFWMARMILMTTYVHDAIPFKDVYIHGILRDKDGRKFSKSLGNGIDPIDVAHEYGTDALRISLIADITPGNDARFSYDKVTDARNLTNKLWNIGRYVATTAPARDGAPRTAADHWIIARLNATIAAVTRHLDHYRFSQAGDALRRFTWNDYADWYVEVHKIEKNDALLQEIFHTLLHLWHPFMPFVTEALFAHFKRSDDRAFLMISRWPEQREPSDSAQEEAFIALQDVVTKIRNIRSVYRLTPQQTPPFFCDEKLSTILTPQNALIEHLASITHTKDAQSRKSAAIATDYGTGFVILEGVIDIAAERERLRGELAEITEVITQREGRLANENFTAHAPTSVIAKERELLTQTRARAREIAKSLENLT